MTNADKIREMDTFDIDDFANKLASTCECCAYKCPGLNSCNEQCGEGFIEWLKKEVEE